MKRWMQDEIGILKKYHPTIAIRGLEYVFNL